MTRSPLAGWWKRLMHRVFCPPDNTVREHWSDESDRYLVWHCARCGGLFKGLRDDGPRYTYTQGKGAA